MTRLLLAALAVASVALTAGFAAALALGRLAPCCDPDLAAGVAVGMGVFTPLLVLGLGLVGEKVATQHLALLHKAGG